MSIPRSWLYVPGHQPDRVLKALSSDADAVVIDLEDAVPADKKSAARRETVARLRERDPGGQSVWVRVNSPATADGEADIEALTGSPVDGLRLPRADDPDLVRTVADQTSLPLMLLVESAVGLLQAPQLARAHSNVCGIALGEADLAADLMVPDDTGLEWARGWIVAAARSAQLNSPIQSVWTDLSDEQGLARSCARGLAQGFFGRSVIHPRQIPVVHEIYTPSVEQIRDAEIVIEAAQQARDQGKAAAVDANGRFVDPAVEARARIIVDRGRQQSNSSDREEEHDTANQ